MTEHNVQRVAIAGFGAIGKVVAEHLDRGIDGLSLAAVSARDTKRAEAAMAGFAHAAPVLPLARLGEFADIVVECAPAALLRDIAEPALALGRTLIVLSCGALVDNFDRSEEHTSELQSLTNLVCRLLLEKKKKRKNE